MKKKTEPFTDKTPMPWGKHKDVVMGELPVSYLVWLLEQDWLPKWKELHAYLIKNQDSILADHKEEQGDEPMTREGYTNYQDFLDDR